ncbi:MAG TPA: nuclear transport factor 2 family protein [Vicinamibacterales bacterium]|nr:nuclear transport factor 2 family protein [Vicinamibacterales bacterium]
MESTSVEKCARDIAAAIGRRDRAALASLLSPEFVHRTPGAGVTTAAEFLAAVEQIPGEILSVTLEHVAVDVVGAAALASGVQHARVRVDGQVIDDRRVFADWFVLENGEWRLRAAVELPPQA